MSMIHSRLVYPGSFDPMTLGHINLIGRACDLCEELIIGVASHSGKEALFSLPERMAMVEGLVTTLPPNIGKKISIKPVEGLLIDFMKKEKISVIVRGLRAISDFEYEFQLAAMNARLEKNIETIFLMAAENHHFISSHLVKQVAALGGDVESFVGPTIAKLLKEKIKG